MRSQRSNLGEKGLRPRGPRVVSGPPGLVGLPGLPSKRSLYCRVGSYCSGTCAISTSTASLPVRHFIINNIKGFMVIIYICTICTCFMSHARYHAIYHTYMHLCKLPLCKNIVYP